MKKNQGHARCNAFAIRFINMNEKFDNLILMDGDGEDRPIEIKSLTNTDLSLTIRLDFFIVFEFLLIFKLLE